MSERSHHRSSRTFSATDVDDNDSQSTPVTESGPSSILSPVVLCILATETGERFAYFGFRAVLTLFFTQALEFPEKDAIALFALTTCGAYLSPIAGAVIADSYWGRYKTILWFGVIYVMGLIVLTTSVAMDEQTLAFRRFGSAVGLFLVCLGTGGIKPCVSAFGADQVAAAHSKRRREGAVLSDDSERDSLFRDEPPGDIRDVSGDSRQNDEDHHVRVFFSYFYFCINVGALTSIALVPIVRGKRGFAAAFLLPTVFMVISMLLFISKRKEYVHLAPGGEKGTSLLHTFRLVWWLALRNLWTLTWIRSYFPSLEPDQQPPIDQNRSDTPFSTNDDNIDENDDRIVGISNDGHDDADELIDDQDSQLEDAAQILHVVPILLMFPIFWCLYDQQSSVWTLQADRMALHGLQPEQLNVVNPLQIMIFIPLFDKLIYPFMEHHTINIAPLRRMSWGMLLTAISFSVSGLVESSIQYRAANDLPKVSVFWQLPQITILTVGEIFFSVTGLEFAYSTSPVQLKAFLMALFLLTTAVGDGFSAILYSTIFSGMNMAIVLHVCAVLMVINFVLFQGVARWWTRHTAHDFRLVLLERDMELR